jgi:hypothetical protein
MSVLRLLIVAMAAAAFMGACGGGSGDSGEDSDQVNALKAALSFAGDDPSAVPPIGETYDCTINPLRQPDPPASPLLPVHGRCFWDVEAQGDSWIVTFRETWFCQDWTADAAGYPPCDSITGNHEWQYLVDLKGNTVDQLSSRGQFAPDM